MVERHARKTSLLDDVVERLPLAADGKSGSTLERARLVDGTPLILKRVVPRGDWVMRATGDHGRAGHLWTRGVLDRVPEVIDHAVIAAERDDGGWTIIMRDVSESLITDGAVLSRAESRRVLEAANALHRAFRGQNIDDLCSLAHRYGFLSPATAHRERSRRDTVPKLLAKGWDLFRQLAPGDIAPALFAILGSPHLLARELERFEHTLIHGDLKVANLGLEGDRVVMLDWGSLTGVAPAAVEFAWYLAINASSIAGTHDEIVEDFRAISGTGCDEVALRLALLGALVQLGWEKALGAVEHPDPAVRERELAGLEWWFGRAREALEIWSPI